MTVQDIIESMPVVARSGSLGAIVASHNQYGPYFRARTAPTGVATILQALARTALADAAALWKSITTLQRDAWQLYAHRLAATHRTQPDNQLTGRDCFIRTNAIRYRLPGGSPDFAIADAPLDVADPILRFSHLRARTVASTIRLFFDTTAPWVTQDGSALLLTASPPLPHAIHFHKAPMRLAAPLWGSSSSPPTSPYDFAWPWLTAFPPASSNVFLRLTLADGRMSRKHYDRATAAIG